MEVTEAYSKICNFLQYEKGLVETVDGASTPFQKYIFTESKKNIKDFDAIYFAGDIPYIFIKRLYDYDEDRIKKIHKLIWNQNRVPLLYIITPNELRIYNCYAEPATPVPDDLLDVPDRMIKKLNLIYDDMEEIKIFSKRYIDTGEFWKLKISKHFKYEFKADQKLLENLKIIQDKLHELKLNYSEIHNLLGRSIFILYLEDRKIIGKSFYKKIIKDAITYFDILKNKKSVYVLYEKLSDKFNGDLFPVTEQEKKNVTKEHLDCIRELFLGTQILTGQRTLWRIYDFSVIPIELISSIYEAFLKSKDDLEQITGTFYTPHSLVEFVLNEILPWPSELDYQYNYRILDPACGSGVFLVESFKRLIARWTYVNNKEPSINDLINILTKHIYGIDINHDAVRVTAFSLYLTMLDHVKTKDVWNKIHFPKLIYNIKDPNMGGNNLFPMDTIEDGPFENIDYDIIVGNPPWGRNYLPKNISEYCKKRGFAQEIAQAFIWRVRNFTSKGIIALFATSKILFNIEKPDKHFRKIFFTNNEIKTIINFSAYRRKKSIKGKQLFSSSVGPATIIIYSPNKTDIDKKILYCTPKPSRIDNIVPGIFIDKSEIKFISNDIILSNDLVWKISMWGGERDLDLIEKFTENNDLFYYLKLYDFKYGRGFQTSRDLYSSDTLSKMVYVETKNIDRYWTNINKIKKINRNKFYRLGNTETYYSPHIIIRQGIVNQNVCASYFDYDCAFKSTAWGISTPEEQSDLLKALTLYFNSTIFKYMLFLTSSSWGIERPIVYLSEILALPGLPFELSNEKILELSSMYDELQMLLKEGYSEDEYKFLILKDKIDNIFYDKLDLSNNDKIYIKDMIDVILDSFSEGSKSRAFDNVDKNDMLNYAHVFCDEINKYLYFDLKKSYSTVFYGDYPLNVICIHFSEEKRDSVVVESNELKNELMKIEKILYNKYSENIYFRKHMKFYDESSIYIIKPSEKRFWTLSIAISDANDTIREGLRGE